MFYEKLNAKYWQEEAATHADWALDYLLDGQLQKAARHQRIAAAFAELARISMRPSAGNLTHALQGVGAGV